MKIHRAFIVPTETMEMGGDGPDEMSYCHIAPGWSTPPLFRRKRLQRFAPRVRRWLVLRSLWRWSADKPFKSYGDWMTQDAP